MNKPSVRIGVQDILGTIDEVEEIIRGLQFADFAKNVTARRAIERCVEIISEASRSIPPEIKARFPHIPWRNVHDIGNVLRHAYGRVDDLIIWRVATVSLPERKKAVSQILESLPEESDG